MSPFPLDPAKTVAQTSTLVFIPSKINGVPLNFKSLKILFDSAISSSINIVDDHPQIEEGYEDSLVKKSYWILMTNGVIPYSRGKILKDRVDILEAPYQAPNVLEAICVIAANILKKQTQFFPSFPLEFTFTACEETIYEKPHNHKRCIRVGGTHLRISTGQTIIHRSLTDYYRSQSTGIAGVIRL